ncbi:MAG: aspartate carbamoyltransferase catalytic subunit [Marinosulfonomonas sp.]|nr:MAG: aspartate carbamoyltransferase catalytic subunit [Marinosulfonomonas sp.]
MSIPSGWEGILDEGEDIRWQGRPDGGVAWKLSNIPAVLFGLAFSGFALFWMVMAASAGGGMWMFGMIHFAAGIGIGIGPVFWSAYRRRNTWYTLTNKRALIATNLPMRGRKLKSYPITKETPLEFSTGDPASITCATERRRSKNGSYEVKIGFERIADGKQVYAQVYAMSREIQKEAA